MKDTITNHLRKRKDKIYDFYYQAYGPIIKKQRLKLNYTQATVSYSICSNTYISKVENNQVIIGRDQLILIMERLHISKRQFAQPEELVRDLHQVMKLFYYRDVQAYEKLIKKFDGYHFYALIELFKMGYYILVKDYNRASSAYEELLNFLTSLDDLAFELFLIFASQLSLKTHHIQLAKFLIDSVYIVHQEYPELKAMYLYTKYVAYGKAHLIMDAMHVYSQLLTDLTETGNIILLNELMIYKAMFNEFFGQSKSLLSLDQLIKNVDAEVVDEYLLVKAFNADQPLQYVQKIKNKDDEIYLIGLYLSAKYALKKKDKALYELMIKEISNRHYQNKSKVDYQQLLDLETDSEWSFYKEYLVNPCLKLAKEKEHIFLIEKISDKVSELLEDNSRYKDAINCKHSARKHIHKIQTI